MFDTLCVQRCSSAYHCCDTWLFVLLSPSYQLRPVWPFSSLTNNAFFCFSHHSLQTLETVVHENHTETLKPPCLAPTIVTQSKSHFFPILTSDFKRILRNTTEVHQNHDSLFHVRWSFHPSRLVKISHAAMIGPIVVKRWRSAMNEPKQRPIQKDIVRLFFNSRATFWCRGTSADSGFLLSLLVSNKIRAAR